jgi:glycosyltransferase involved in cell wall biosynthesis
MKKIKVLQVNKLYAPHIGGVERVVQDIAEGLNASTDMEVLVCQTKGRASVDNVNGVKVIRAGSLGIFNSMPLSFSFFTFLRRFSKDRDIVHFHMPFPLADIAFFMSGYKGKVILWWHSAIVRQKTLLKLYKPVMNKLLKRADCIVVATEGHINGSRYLEPFREKCVIIPYGTNINLYETTNVDSHKTDFESSDTVKEQSDHKVTKEKKDKKVLFIGRLVYYKGVNVLLDAFCKVRDAHLYIAGDGPLQSQFEQQALSLGIKEHVSFLGHADDNQIRELLSCCDLFVLPSIAESEAFGIVQIEAMAYSKPVINTSLSTGVPYVSLHEQTGLTVPPGDADALARAIQRLVDCDDERLQMGRNARKRFEEYFTMDKMLESIYRLYQDILV